MLRFFFTSLLVSSALAVPSPPSTHHADGQLLAGYAVTDPLPQVNFLVPKSWAGDIPIGAPYGNDSLFFWLWESQCSPATDDLIIWLNGGPGCSSMLGLFKEHGPILFPNESATPQPNPYSWTKLANVLYIDQPVGTGFSYGNHGAVSNNDDNAAFVQWLSAFFEVFPSMKNRKIHLMGESYGGVFIPYIAQAIQQRHATLGFKLASIGLGDSTWGNAAALTDVVATSYIKNHSHQPGTKVAPDVLAVLEQGDQKCGFTSVLSQLTYPPTGKIIIPCNPEDSSYKRQSPPPGYDPDICDFTNGTQTADEVRFIINSTSPSSCYGLCATYEAAYNYFADDTTRCFNAYDISLDCSITSGYSDTAFEAYLNLPTVQSVIHAPHTSYTQCNATLVASLTTHAARAEPPAYVVLPRLLAAGTRVHLWSGTLDYLLPPLGTELAIQNMTWNEAQGFRERPRRWWHAGGRVAGVYSVERGLGYCRFEGAGHRTAQDRPEAAFVFVRDRVVGDRELPWV